MKHLILLGDSIFDNAAYTLGGPAVINHVQQQLPADWRASLGAVDGSTTDDIADQIQAIPPNATHLALSVGGNNAIMRSDILDTPVASSAEALLLFSEVIREFEAAYRAAVTACLNLKLPLHICTIYNGNFDEPGYQQRVVVALTLFNDVIIRVATEHRLQVIDLRFICTQPQDYANPIEPSAAGGAKIAKAIVCALTEAQVSVRGACVLAD